MRLNCSLEHEFHIALTNFKLHLQARGYTNVHLDAPFQFLPQRQELLAQHDHKKSFSGIPFVTTFTAEVKQFKKEVLLALTTPAGLELHPDLEYVLDRKNRPLLSLTKEKNLRDIFVSAKLDNSVIFIYSTYI